MKAILKGHWQNLSMALTVKKSVGLMDVLPDALVELLLSNVKSAKDVAVCSCVCKRWRELMSLAHSLSFARNIGDEKGIRSDWIVTQMVRSMTSLEELTVYCPFSRLSLLAWLSHTKLSLKKLELRVDDLGEKQNANSSMSKLASISCASLLQTLRLWGVLLSEKPDWQFFCHLHTLEIVEARLHDSALRGILGACPVLINLILLRCSGIHNATFEMGRLNHCRLDFYGLGDCCIKIIAPKLEFLEVQGASCLHIIGKHNLHHLSVANNAGKVKKLEVGNLHGLQSLSLRGVQWCWEAIITVLQLATELEELSMRVEFCGEGDKLEPFPEVDMVNFFSGHSKLKSFELQGAMFAALSHKNSLSKLSSMFTIDCLERVSITIRSPLNADQKMATLESLVKCSPNLRILNIRISQMKNCETVADDFFCRILGLKLRYDFIQIE